VAALAERSSWFDDELVVGRSRWAVVDPFMVQHAISRSSDDQPAIRTPRSAHRSGPI
jgi:hypothetical protein